MIKQILVSIGCCAFIAPLALAHGERGQSTATSTEQGVTVTGRIVTTTVQEGAAANYQPAKTLVVRQNGKDKNTYVLNGTGHVVNKKGEIIRTAIKPGAHVRVYFASANGVRTIDHVVVD
jgi:hypothetical protein